MININNLNTKEDFIKFYEAIPEDQWCTGTFKRIDLTNLSHKCCALGHLGMKVHIDIHRNVAAKRLQSFFNEDPSGRASSVPVLAINDDIDQRDYKGATPKQRIINALKSLK